MRMAATIHQTSSRKLDPYLELEFYLARAQKDIRDAFEHLELGRCSCAGKQSPSITVDENCDDDLITPPTPLPPTPPTRSDSLVIHSRFEKMPRSSLLPSSPVVVSDVDSLTNFVDALLKEVDAMTSEQDMSEKKKTISEIGLGPLVALDATRGKTDSRVSKFHKRNCDLKAFLRQIERSISSRSLLCPADVDNNDPQCDATTQTSPFESPAISDRSNSDSDFTFSDMDSEATSTSCDKLSQSIKLSKLAPLNVSTKSGSDADANTIDVVSADGVTDISERLLKDGPLSAPAACHEWLSDAPPPLAPCHWVNLWLDVNKSCSAPILDSRHHQLLDNVGLSRINWDGSLKATTCTQAMSTKNRSQSAKQLTELEAVEACKWLRAAGFPQYAQMFEDMQFPIDVSSVQKDHYFLDQDSIQSLFRRLNALNRCARMRLDNVPRKISVCADDSDEENQCALSENWKFQRQSRRWSRIPGNFDAAILAAQQAREDLESEDVDNRMEKSPKEDDNVESDIPNIPLMRDTTVIAMATSAIPHPQPFDSVMTTTETIASPGVGLRRTGSDRFKDGAKALLRRVESLKTRRSRRKNREAVVISGPQLLDVPSLDDHVACVQITPPDTPQQQIHPFTCNNNSGGGGGGSSSPPSSNSPSDMSQHSTPPSVHASDSQGSGRCFFGGSGLTTATTRRRGGDNDASYALSDSECSPTLWRSRTTSPTSRTMAARSYIQQYLTPDDSPRLFPNTCSTLFPDMDNDDEDDRGINHRTGSFHLSRNESTAYRDRLAKETEGIKQQKLCQQSDADNVGQQQQQQLQDDRHSLYDNVPVVIFNKGYTDEHGEPLHENDIFRNITNLNLAFAAARCSPNDQKSGAEKSVSTTAESASNNEEADSSSLASSSAQLPSASTTNERRDSGVGLSISRSNSRESAVQQQQPQNRSRPRWQVSSQCHRPSVVCRSLPLNGLSTGQMIVLRKLALLKLTALMERYCPSNRTGWNWAMPKFIKRMKMPDYKEKAVFGVPLIVVLQRTGQPLPMPIQAAIRHLRKNAMDSVGLFRKSGVRSRIQKLKNLCETSGSHSNGIIGVECTATSDLERMTSMYEDQQPYDVADMVKQYFRELPEALLTNKMSETFISIYQYVNDDMRLEALQASLILMPDENREVLQAVLSFLSDVASRASENQMTASNLAVCFAPSLFQMNSPRRSHSTSPRRRKTVGAPDQRELNETRAAHECLTHMIQDFHTIFSIPEDILAQCPCPELDRGEAPAMDELLFQQNTAFADPVKTNICNWHAMVEANIQWIFKESREKFKGNGWVQSTTTATTLTHAATGGIVAEGTEVSFKKLGDGNPLRIWKVSVDVEAPPVELLNRVLRERHLWDVHLLKWRVIDRLDKQTEIFQYVTNSMTPLPPRDFCVLRSWQTDFPKGTCVLVEMSVEHPDATPLVNGVRANVLSSTFLIEPCGSGKSRVTHVSRVDIRGRSPDWYNKVYGSLCSMFISQLRDSLQHTTEGPESKV